MPMYKCPQCQTQSIPLKDKYRAGMWGIVYCKHCPARLCATPWALGMFFMFYVWDVIWFVGLYRYTHDVRNFVYMLIVWIGLDAVNVSFMPLSAMKRKPQS